MRHTSTRPVSWPLYVKRIYVFMRDAEEGLRASLIRDEPEDLLDVQQSLEDLAVFAQKNKSPGTRDDLARAFQKLLADADPQRVQRRGDRGVHDLLRRMELLVHMMQLVKTASLRDKLIRVAYANPGEVRAAILPLLHDERG